MTTAAAAVSDTTITAAQNGDQDAMWAILTAYEPMMKNVVRTVAPAANQEDAEDLIQEARMVLIQRVRDYSTEASSAQLHTYAYPAVRRAVAEEWLRSTTTLSIDPSAALTVKRALWSAEGDVETAWLIVSASEDSRRRMSREAFVSVCEALLEADSLEKPVASHGGGGGVGAVAVTLGDTLPDASSDFTDATERRDLARWLLTQIPPRQAFALRAFYGLGMQVMTDEEAADDLAIRQAKNVRVLRTRGIANAQSVAAGNHITLAA